MNNEQMIAEIIECGRAIARLNARVDDIIKRIDDQKRVADSLHTLAISVEKQTSQLEQQGNDIATLRADVDDIKTKPAKRWDLIINSIISIIAGWAISTLFKI